MRCPKCGDLSDKVLDSRSAHDGKVIRRRRECLACGHRFTTFEEIMREELRVIKNDGRHEDFSRQKIYDGVMAACQKRPVSAAQVNALIDGVVDEIYGMDTNDVRTSLIGELVMRRLEELDSVAYVRFASVYRRFADVGQFRRTVEEMEGSSDEPAEPGK